MSTYSKAQISAIAKIDKPFRPIGNKGAVVKFRAVGDIYIAVDGSGIIEEYNEMVGGFDYTDLDGNEIDYRNAVETIAGLIA